MKDKIIRFLFDKYTVLTLFIVVFFSALFNNIPAYILAHLISSYSQERLFLYNTTGTFWHGSGLLVVADKKALQSAPLVMLDWNIKLGLKKFVDVKFTIGDNVPVAEAYINQNGADLEKLNLSLSISQVSQIFGLVHDLGLSGNINVQADLLHLGRNNKGVLTVRLTDLSSSFSPVNPLGSYNVNLDVHNGGISVSSASDSVLSLSGRGSLDGLSLNARVSDDKKEKMTQLVTFMGFPAPDGSYTLKVF